jgi:hypothetical protein
VACWEVHFEKCRELLARYGYGISYDISPIEKENEDDVRAAPQMVNPGMEEQTPVEIPVSTTTIAVPRPKKEALIETPQPSVIPVPKADEMAPLPHIAPYPYPYPPETTTASSMSRTADVVSDMPVEPMVGSEEWLRKVLGESR